MVAAINGIHNESDKAKILTSSDEFDDSDETGQALNDSLIEEFISDVRGRQFPGDNSRQWDEQHNQPGTSTQNKSQQSPEEKANKVIRDAEAGKACIYEVPGNEFLDFQHLPAPNYDLDFNCDYLHSAMVEESYQLVASHLDEVIQANIVKGDYIDFGKLVPKDRVLTADDSRYKMIVREGKTFWVPASSNESTEITSYHRWEQAFRVYSDVYMQAFPHRSSELVQYGHLIHTASQTYTWENVYMYDKDFRLHMSQHPKRRWSIILQQAWSVRLQDKICQGNGGNH